jgi:hypothetical protein
MNVPTEFVGSTLTTSMLATVTTTTTTATGMLTENGEGDGGGLFPTGLMTQVPTGWPYTKYGVGRKRETATWALTSIGTEGSGMVEEETVGLVKAVVSWFPRPLFNQVEMGLGLGRAADDEVQRRAVE